MLCSTLKAVWSWVDAEHARRASGWRILYAIHLLLAGEWCGSEHASPVLAYGAREAARAMTHGVSLDLAWRTPSYPAETKQLLVRVANSSSDHPAVHAASPPSVRCI